MDAVRQLAQVGEQVPGVGLQLVEHVARRTARRGRAWLRASRSFGDQRDDVLLHAVVDVALDPPALDVLGRDDPGAGPGELVDLLGQAAR